MNNQNETSDTPVRFDEDAVCEVCGKFGAYEFGEKHLCADCYESRGSCCPEFGDFDLWESGEPGDKPGKPQP